MRNVDHKLLQAIHASVLAVMLAAEASAKSSDEAEGEPGGPLATAAALVVASAQAGDEIVDSVADELQEAKPTLLQLAARFGGDWFASLVDRPVHEETAVDRVVMGTRAKGTAITDGRVTMEQLEAESDDHCVTFLLTLRGETVSRTRSTQGPVQVRCQSTMPFVATMRIQFDGERFSAGHVDYTGSVEMHVTSLKIDARRGRRLIRRVASRRIADRQACAEQIAYGQTRDRVVGSFQECVTSHLQKLNHRISKIDLGEAFKAVVQGRDATRSPGDGSASGVGLREGSVASHREDAITDIAVPTLPSLIRRSSNE
ncbi:MAG: hypothetical protein KDA61_10170 [Planctomycetales bacterium]|nr:hypothetical protein [Planctomycetales bacterium]